ncbi:hypothetical protein SDC9_164995 [bioreactor metagenome]|uniref:Uncharacterized protein n=1 Tax=bioreactor metagenome TaxID=1076179 RepID=A0A645FVC2_9ZZZZ
MQWVINARMHEPVCLNARRNIRGFERYHDIIEACALKYPYMLQRAFNHCLRRRRAEPIKQRFIKRAAVHAYAYRHAALFSRAYKLFNVRFTAYVAWVKAQLVHAVLNGGDAELIVEMNIGDDRDSRLTLD